MPEPIVRAGLKGNQQDLTAIQKGVIFPQLDPREPGEGEDDLVFESKYEFYRIQVNSPDVSVNLATGTKTKMKNRYVQFTNGVFIPKKGKTPAEIAESKEDVETLFAAKGFGAPHQSNFWLRKDRQKKEVNGAITTLLDQLKSRPDLVSLVSQRLGELNISTKKFTMPKAPAEPKEPTGEAQADETNL